MSDDPVFQAAHEMATESFAEIRRVLDGLPAEALDWQPTDYETNSIAVLTAHALGSIRNWLHVALDLPAPPRERAAEFRTSFTEPAAIRAFADALIGECEGVFERAAPSDWGAERSRAGDPETYTAAWSLIHGVEHMREHVGQMMLTRQLWEAQASW